MTHAVLLPDRVPFPHPANGRLQAIKDFLRTYLLLDAPDGTPAPLAFEPLVKMDLRMLGQEGYVATVFSHALPAFLQMMERQRRRRKQAAGGWRKPNCYSPRDLKQPLYDHVAMIGQSSYALCLALGDELRLLLRVLRAAQLTYRRGAKYDWKDRDWQRTWHAQQRAATETLLRIAHISARLRERAGRWFAEQCVRWNLRRLWKELFGANVPPTGEVWRWIFQIKLPPKVKLRILRRLVVERINGHPIPPPFERLMTPVMTWRRKPGTASGESSLKTGVCC
ncbi:MAG TPA: hypothetical protein VH540_03120 [Ktedonobacterales bacterium]|jgi:hypothetical protein